MNKVKVFKNFFKELREDPELFYAYQANIAMSFLDEHHNFKKKHDKKVLNKKELHTVANNAATNFLNLLTKEDK